MNSNLSELLLQFSNLEFAYFLKYRLPEFSDHSKKRIYQELKRRDLSKDNLLQLLDVEINRIPENCQRCNSDKFFTETRIEQTGSRYNPEKEIFTNRCIVCGYNGQLEEQLNPRGFWGWIKKTLNYSSIL